MAKKNKAIFLDRDGTINAESLSYTYRIRDFEFLPGAIEAMKILAKTDYKLIVVTNQAGVAKGVYTEEDINKVHHHMVSELKKHGVKIHGVYYCPHHPKGTVGNYSIICECRKPGTRLFHEASKEFDIDLGKSWIIGDMQRDIEAGIILGCKTIMVKSNARDDDYYKQITVEPDYFVNGLFEAVNIIIGEEKTIGEEDASGKNKGGC